MRLGITLIVIFPGRLANQPTRTCVALGHKKVGHHALWYHVATVGKQIPTFRGNLFHSPQGPISIVDGSWPMKNRDPFIYCRGVLPRKNGIPFCIAGFYTHTVSPFPIRVVCTEPLTSKATHSQALPSFHGYLVPKFQPADSPSQMKFLVICNNTNIQHLLYISLWSFLKQF
jgi:hypothetical protein